MEKKIRRNFWWMSLWVMILTTLLISGCPKSKQTVPSETAPPGEEKKGTSGTVAPGAEEGPISSGSVLLNPAVPKDAKTIQSRLTEQGLYRGAIDGIWGKLSRAALKSFKEQNSLENPDKWDKETQILLFRGTNK